MKKYHILVSDHLHPAGWEILHQAGQEDEAEPQHHRRKHQGQRGCGPGLFVYRRLRQAAGGRIAEMDRNRDQSVCCSAGGGRILAEEKLGSRINIRRVRMAAETGAPTLVSNCPFCLTMFEDGIKGAELEERLKPRDIAEILAERIQVIEDKGQGTE